VLLSEHGSSFDVYSYTYAGLRANHGQQLRPTGTLNLHHYITTTAQVLASALTPLDRLIFLCTEAHLLVVNSTSCQLLLVHEINDQTNSMSYFLSPTNPVCSRLAGLVAVEGTNSLVGTDNLENLVLAAYDRTGNTMRVDVSSEGCFRSFRVAGNWLVAYESRLGGLVGFDMNEVGSRRGKDVFGKVRFRLQIEGRLGYCGASEGKGGTELEL
jgi:hypothetical protein